MQAEAPQAWRPFLVRALFQHKRGKKLGKGLTVLCELPYAQGRQSGWLLLAVRLARADGQAQRGHGLELAETFVEPQ